ncbi:DUF4806 domain-containing protein [Aphis craccivora]|uniref:DUF4806 domain-containing protein n=1 Tax=Aphis craccivora TaxID=307492 RepID=A0A6G0VTH1_APHCR|nr:DUF4806 domain-containing protein [Aphis craccivora]
MSNVNQMVKNLIPVDDTNWSLLVKIDVIKYNLSEVDTEVESILKSQRKNRAKKKLFFEDEQSSVQHLKRSSKNIEATKVTKLNAEKLPILPKPPKSFTQTQIKKSKAVQYHESVLTISDCPVEDFANAGINPTYRTTQN